MSATWQKDLRDLIAALADVSEATTEVWWNQAKSGQGGAHIVLRQIAGPRDVSHEGPVQLGNARVEINCFAETTAAAIALRDAINTALVGKTFTTAGGNAPSSGNQFLAILHGNDMEFPAPEVDLQRAATDLLLTYRLAA